MKNETKVSLRCVGTFKVKHAVHPTLTKPLITAIQNRFVLEKNESEVTLGKYE